MSLEEFKLWLQRGPVESYDQAVAAFLLRAKVRAKEMRRDVYVFTPKRGLFMLQYVRPELRETKHDWLVTWKDGKVTNAREEQSTWATK